jgi:hypothetical protein
MSKLETRKENTKSDIKDVQNCQEAAKKELTSFEKNSKNAQKMIVDLEKKYSWIQSDRVYFG